MWQTRVKEIFFIFLPGAAFGTAKQAFWIRRQISSKRRNMLIQVAFTKHVKNARESVCHWKSKVQSTFFPQIPMYNLVRHIRCRTHQPQTQPKAKLNLVCILVGFLYWSNERMSLNVSSTVYIASCNQPEYMPKTKSKCQLILERTKFSTIKQYRISKLLCEEMCLNDIGDTSR